MLGLVSTGFASNFPASQMEQTADFTLPRISIQDIFNNEQDVGKEVLRLMQKHRYIVVSGTAAAAEDHIIKNGFDESLKFFATDQKVCGRPSLWPFEDSHAMLCS